MDFTTKSKISKIWKKVRSYTITTKDKIQAFHSDFGGSGTGIFRHIFSFSYDGEKNLGEIGPPKDYRPEFQILRIRSWQSYLESEIAQTITKKFALWVVGSGLKLQAEPAAKVLESENIKIDAEQFNEVVESRFGLFAKSISSDHAKMQSLNAKAKEAFLNAIVGGDVLVIQRFK